MKILFQCIHSSPEGSKIESKENGFDENGDRDQYNKLLDLGLVEQVAQKLDAIYKEGEPPLFLSRAFLPDFDLSWIAW